MDDDDDECEAPWMLDELSPLAKWDKQLNSMPVFK